MPIGDTTIKKRTSCYTSVVVWKIAIVQGWVRLGLGGVPEKFSTL